MKETKELLKFVFAAVMASEKAAKDGFDWSDAAHFIPVAIMLPAAIGGSVNIADEIRTMDARKKDELKAYIATELDLENDVVEKVIESALSIALDFADFFTEWKNK